MSGSGPTAYEGWAIIEVFGHRRLGGYVQEAEQYGARMVRIDIPTEPPATQFYGGNAIYCLTPTTEEIATAVAQRSAPAPVQRWELPARVGGTVETSPTYDDDGDDEPTF